MTLHVISLGLLVLVIAPSHAQEVTIQPLSVTQVEGLYAYFKCFSPDSKNSFWTINGTTTQELRYPTEKVDIIQNSPSILRIRASRDFHNSVIQCEVLFEDHTTSSSNNATLEVFSPEPTVSFQSDDIIGICWNPPPSPDMAVCIDIYQRTDNTTLLMDSTCEVTSYSFHTRGRDICSEYFFTLTPTNNGSNGTTSSPKLLKFNTTKGSGGSISVYQGSPHSGKTGVFNGTVPECDKPINYRITSASLLLPVTGQYMRPPLEFPLPKNVQDLLTITFTYNSGATLVYHNLPFNTQVVQSVEVSPCPDDDCVRVRPVLIKGALPPDTQVVFQLDHHGGKPVFVTTIGSDTDAPPEVTVQPHVPPGEYHWSVFLLKEKLQAQVSSVVSSGYITVTSGPTRKPPTPTAEMTLTPLNGDVVVRCPEGVPCYILSYPTDHPGERTINRQGALLFYNGSSVVVAMLTWDDGSTLQLSHVKQLRKEDFFTLTPSYLELYIVIGFLTALLLPSLVSLVVLVILYLVYKRRKSYGIKTQSERILNQSVESRQENHYTCTELDALGGQVQTPDNNQNESSLYNDDHGDDLIYESVDVSSEREDQENELQTDPEENVGGHDSEQDVPAVVEYEDQTKRFLVHKSLSKDSEDTKKSGDTEDFNNIIIEANQQQQQQQQVDETEAISNVNSHNNLKDLELDP